MWTTHSSARSGCSAARSPETSIFLRSDLQDDLASIQTDVDRALVCTQRLLCRTLAGNNVYVLTVTQPATQVSRWD